MCFGNDQDSLRRTVEAELEKCNFKKVGEVLCQVWNELLIEKCCGPFRTNWLRAFPNRFLSAPVQFRQDPGDPTVPPFSQVKTNQQSSRECVTYVEFTSQASQL